MLNAPLVSVIMPAFNRRRTLPDSIDSVIRQRYANWELVIVDDGSTDDTEILVRHYMSQDQRIRYIHIRSNKGPSAARNMGIRNSRGKYIAFLDSDDEWLDNHLADCMTALSEEGVSVCFALWMEKNSVGEVHPPHDNDFEGEKLERVFQELNPVVHQNRLLFSGSDFLEFNYSVCTFFCTHINTMVFHREVIEKAGLFNEKLWASEDLDFISRVIHHYSFCLIKDYHFLYSQGEDNIHCFMDKHKMTLEEIVGNPRIVRKLTFCGVYRGKTYKLMKTLFQNSGRIKQKTLCIERCNKRIGDKYFTLGYINQKTHKVKAVYYLLKSLAYQFNQKRVKLLINILAPFAFKDLKITEGDLRLYS